ncbi:MAG: hypothetical protein ACREOY_11515 [Candidatus Dormibacteraceae bacterium]
MRRASLRLRVSWVSLLIVGLATLVYGLVVVVLPSSDVQYVRAGGVASIGMGLFGVMITLAPYRRRERWAYMALWYYPVFWTAHLVGNLPPGRDHIHQVVFILLSLVGLLLPIDQYFLRRTH